MNLLIHIFRSRYFMLNEEGKDNNYLIFIFRDGSLGLVTFPKLSES